jgi:DNA primase
MPRYTEQSVRAVKDAVDMVDLVGTRTELRRSGADSWSGRCPFHEERTPSFSVKPSEKVYYCFGCQAAGDAIRFMQETEGVDFKRALELLADRYGVTLEAEAESPGEASRRQRRERLQALLDRTCGYFERVLWDSAEGAPAREYLAGRGLEEGILREFRVGYAPSAFARVLDGSRRAGFSEAELLAVDVVMRSTEHPGRVYDRFRRRITFPLCDQRGKVLGFGGRAMSEQSGAKYVNSRDNEIYHKGRQLFGVHLARSHAAKAGSIVLCEGYTDVIAAHQAGVRNCVGLMGTALTDEQVSELARLAPTVVLALDADGAGFQAMLKAEGAAAKLSFEKRIDLRIAALPPGSDPADVLTRDGPDAVAALLGRSLPFVRFRVERLLSGGDRDSGEGRDRILAQLRPIFAELGPGAMREQLQREVATRLAVSERLVEQLLAGRDGAAAATAQPARHAVALDAGERTERAFLELCIALPERGRDLLAEIDVDAVFGSPLTRAAARHLRAHIETPASGVEDPALASLLVELAVRAAALAPVAAQLEVELRQLELARVERSIAGARGAGAAKLSDLARERAELKRELDAWLGRALDQTGAARD